MVSSRWRSEAKAGCQQLEEALGVTRVARVTGLDRSGVEVACAVRPRGHVLQVSNGKGEVFEQARMGALLEAAELWAAESVDPTGLIIGSLAEVQSGFPGEVWAAGEIGLAPGAEHMWSPDTRIAWRSGIGLFDQAPVLVPAQAVHCPPSGSVPLGPALFAWSSNGMGAHAERDAAILHALLEAIERDQLARSLPEGWTPSEVARRIVDRSLLAKAAPRTARWVERLAEAELSAWLFDLTPRGRGRIGLSVGGAILVDQRRGPIPLTAGYACRLDWDKALLGALLEAAQSRLTDIHGAREDVASADREDAETLAEWCERASRRGGRRVELARGVGARRLTGEGAIAKVLRGLAGAGFARAAVVDLEPPGFPVHVVKAIVPGLVVSELL